MVPVQPYSVPVPLAGKYNKKWRLVQDATNLSIKKDKVNQQMADKNLIGGKYTSYLSNLQVF